MIKSNQIVSYLVFYRKIKTFQTLMISWSSRSLAATRPGPGAGDRRSPARSSRTRGSICLKQLHLGFSVVFVCCICICIRFTWPSQGSSSCSLGALRVCWGWVGDKAGCSLLWRGLHLLALLAPSVKINIFCCFYDSYYLIPTATEGLLYIWIYYKASTLKSIDSFSSIPS